MRYPVLSVEWGIYAASKSNLLPRIFTHCVLPDLGEKVMPKSQRDSFYGVVPKICQIQTVAVNNHRSSSTNAWLRHVSDRIKEGKHGSDCYDDDLASPAHLLIVGGNHKNDIVDDGGTTARLSTVAAIRACTSTRCFGDRTVIAWAVADLNAPNSVNDVLQKIEAGATGIITQPLLSRRAYDSLARYSEIMNGPSLPTVTIVAGMALPKTLRGLLFWESLLQSRLEDDPMFQDHCNYFRSSGNDLEWALAQMKALDPFDMIKGIHFMPLQNGRALDMMLNTVVEKDQPSRQ
jgi:hypothetical protein